MKTSPYLANPSIGNGYLTEAYLFSLRRKWTLLARIIGLALSCEIRCPIPRRLFIPHPTGIVVGVEAHLENDVVLMQQVTLGCHSAYAVESPEDGDPTIREGVYVGPGAKILGNITIGEWSIVGANAVVTKSVPPYSIVVGYNNVLLKTTKELSPTLLKTYARNSGNHQPIAC